MTFNLSIIDLPNSLFSRVEEVRADGSKLVLYLPKNIADTLKRLPAAAQLALINRGDPDQKRSL